MHPLILALLRVPVVVCSMAQQHDTGGAAKPQANSPEQLRDKEASFEENAKKRSIGFNRYPLIKTYIKTFFHHAICVSRLPVFHWRLYGQQSNWLATISDNQPRLLVIEKIQ